MKDIFSFFVSLVVVICCALPVHAQTTPTTVTLKEETLEGKILRIPEETTPSKTSKLYQKLEILITSGSRRGDMITVENGIIPTVNQQLYRQGDELVISKIIGDDGKDTFYISDYVRRNALLQLFILFLICTIAIARWRGVLSLLGMSLSFLVIFLFILPKILSGSNPVTIAIIGSIIIIPVSFFLSHGINRKTISAIAGTLIALTITGMLSYTFVQAAHLTGFASEEAGFLQNIMQGSIHIKGLLLSGIIIGVLGVLDDITISQSAIVFQLQEANPNFGFTQLYSRAMNVGQDHISSMVNTLILVYTGAALPLLLLFIHNPHPFREIINYEIIADEIVRTLVGSIGLILAVPITTAIAVLAVKTQKNTKEATV